MTFSQEGGLAPALLKEFPFQQSGGKSTFLTCKLMLVERLDFKELNSTTALDLNLQI
ncbi:MAG TPA: hypothetical protein VIW64_07805 [Pyrinomonadaceae bacterium]|jgi:hypothetical protein